MKHPITAKPSYRKVVAALVESEERYRTLVEGVRRYAIFMLNPNGIIMTWNRGIYELLGYSREEVVGRSGGMVFNKKDRAAGTFEKELACAPAVTPGLEKGGRGRPVTPQPLLVLTSWRSDRSDYHHKTPRQYRAANTKHESAVLAIIQNKSFEPRVVSKLLFVEFGA